MSKSEVTYFHLNGKQKKNADWEINQLNKVSEHMKHDTKDITIYNSLFHSNGVWSKFI